MLTTLRLLVGKEPVRALARSRSGATAIEYTLIAGVMAVALVAALPLVATPLGELMTSIADAFG